MLESPCRRGCCVMLSCDETGAGHCHVAWLGRSDSSLSQSTRADLADLEGVPGHHPEVEAHPQPTHQCIQYHDQPVGAPAPPAILKILVRLMLNLT